MKNAIILHGAGDNPNKFWIPSIKSFLEKNGYSVWAPLLPDAEKPDLKKQLPFVLTGGVFNKDTVLISHSAGGPLALSILENINIKIHKTIIISGYIFQSKEQPTLILRPKYNTEKIKNNCSDLIFINSDNDPWGCNDEQGLKMWKQFGGTLILRENEGHCGSGTFNQPYTHFPLLEKLLKVEHSRSVIDGSDKK
jgi:uncharacterized protein